MQRSGWFPVVVVLLLFANLLLLAVLVFQIDTREERLIEQGAQFRALAESTERLRVEVQKFGRGGGLVAPAAAPTASRRWLHPEVANLLEPHDFAITASDAKSGGRLTWLYGSDPKGFNTMIENSADVQNLATYVGAELADRMAWTDPDKYYGKVAERVEITNDNQEFTVYLRPGVKWHAPGNLDLDDPKYAWLRGEHELTTRDVDFSLQILMHPQVENGPTKSYYEDLEGWEVVDDHTFIVRWKRPYYGAIEGTLGIPLLPEFLYAYDEQGRRFPEETLGTNFNRHWYNSKGMVGTGPYRMVSYEPGVAIRLERNEDYFGELPAIQEIVFEIFTDPNLSLLKLRSHQHDFGVLQPGQYREEIQRWESRPVAERPADSPFLNGRIEHKKYVGMSYFYVGWNADRSLFRDKRVRYAMTHALNRQAIIDNVYVGLGRIPPGHFFSESPYNDPAIQPRPFDLGKARALLAEAGFTDSDGDGLLDKDLDPDDGVDRRTPFEFTLLIYASSPEMASTANIYKDDLLQIGVRMRIEEAEWSLMQKRMEERDFDAFTGGWALSWDPDPYQVWHSSQADVPKGSNMVGFRNPEADRLMVTLRATFDPEERLALLHRLHRILDEEEPYTLLVVRESVACWWDDVHRVVFAKLRPHARALAWWTDEKR